MSERTPLRHFCAVCPHSGGLQAEMFEADAATIREAHRAFWGLCGGSRYVDRIYELAGGTWAVVWMVGWSLDEGAASRLSR